MANENNKLDYSTDDSASSAIIIKLKSVPKTNGLIKNFEESYKQGKPVPYGIAKNSHNLEKRCLYSIFVIVHDGNDNFMEVFLGECVFTDNDEKYKEKNPYKLDIRFKYHNTVIDNSIKNLIASTNLKLDDDFEHGEYLIKEDSEYLCSLIKFLANDPISFPGNDLKYGPIDSEEKLHPLAQRNEYCRRQYDLRQPSDVRGEFQRDYERIVHSKAFRRMVDKAQVFSSSKGDYYRTRMTHSQVVAQIARGIAAGLDLNVNLTEAIALGHDLGHTPFGHQGERTLNDILHDKISIIKNPELFDDAFGGFKHNYQSLRVAAVLEEQYFEIEGMDLSYQTLEGMLKHTKTKDKKTEEPLCALSEFIHDNNAQDELCFDERECTTLEGQIVAIADEIAQRGHDLDDALSSGTLTLDEMSKQLNLKKLEELKEKLDPIINAEHGERFFPDKTELINSRVTSEVLHYFITDVIGESQKKMCEYISLKKEANFEDYGHRITEKLISFSKNGKKICKFLEMLIENRVINSHSVALFDNNGAAIIETLFRTYYNNPRLLHNGTKRRIMTEIRRFTKNVVDLINGSHKIIGDELNLMTQTDLSDENTKLSEAEKEEYKMKRRILVRNICDYIAGMTDTYATNEFNRIVKPL